MTEPDTITLNAPPPRVAVVPAAYVLHYYTTHCQCCGTVSNGSDFYAQTFIRTRMHTGTAKQLTRCAVPLYNVPVERIHVGLRRTPFCAECQVIDLSHLPPPPSESQVYDLAGPDLKDRPKRTASAVAKPPAARKATLGDLA